MGSFSHGQLVQQVASTATAASTTTLTSTSLQIQNFTGSTTQTIKLPSTSGMLIGQYFEIYNNSTGALTIQYQDASSFTPVPTVAAGNSLIIKLLTTGTSNGTWATSYIASSSGFSNPMTTAGDIIYESGTPAPARLAIGSTGQVLTVAAGLPSWATPAAKTAPTVQKFTSTGTTVGYLFTVTSANATVGATYTNNSITFTVANTISSSTRLFMTSSGAPTASGTLTKSSGTGDSTITFSSNQAIAQYTTPTSPAPLYLRVTAIGGGGGGGGSGQTANPGVAGSGADTAFGANIIFAFGGVGANGESPGAGGSFSLGSAIGFGIPGSGGNPGMYTTINTVLGVAGTGTAGPLGGGPGNNTAGNAGFSAAANTGSGGGGGTMSQTTNAIYGGASGGAGGLVNGAFISSPSSTYYYAVGAGGSAGLASTSGFNGGAGGSGLLVIEEYYQ